MGKAKKGVVMEFQNLSVSKVDREYRELEKRVREELCAIFGISMVECLKLLVEKADERIRAARAQQASAAVDADGAFDKE